MESTSCGAECPFVKQGFCSNERECPNYIESWWVKGAEQEHVLLKDCAPKRMVLQQQHLQSRFEGVQEALEQSRNEYNKLIVYIQNILGLAQNIIEANVSKPAVEDKSDEKPTNLLDVSND